MVKLNQKGFTLVELIGVIAISSIIIAPLLFSLVGNFEVNVRQMRRSAAAVLSETTVSSFQNIYFRDVSRLVNDSVANDEMYVMVNSERCDLFTAREETTFDTVIDYIGTELEDIYSSPGDPRGDGARGVCDKVFSLTVLNEGFESKDFMVFLAPYFINEDNSSSWQNSLEANIPNTDIILPEKVLEEFLRIPLDENPPEMIFRIIVYIRYDERESDTLIRSALITPNWAPPVSTGDGDDE